LIKKSKCLHSANSNTKIKNRHYGVQAQNKNATSLRLCFYLQSRAGDFIRAVLRDKDGEDGRKSARRLFRLCRSAIGGLWWSEGGGVIENIADKDGFCWASMIRLPGFVTDKVFEDAKLSLKKKKPGLDLSKAKLIGFAEGKCAQIMHIGSYDDEPRITAVLKQFIAESGYACDFNESRRHHKIYLGDPRKMPAEKLRTIIRYPIKQV
jgi:hypothetical protein